MQNSDGFFTTFIFGIWSVFFQVDKQFAAAKLYKTIRLYETMT